MRILDINNLKKYYGKSRGVDDVTLHVDEGEILGFIGPNGAGKSTTIRCALSLIFPTAGTITIFGKDARTDRVEIAKEIGYLPGEVFYYDNMKVRDLLSYSASFYKGSFRKETDRLLEIMELDPDRKIEDLSLGNKKKVGIVQGLQHDPRFIILDEPTSGLDPLMQQRFFSLIQEKRDKGATVLFSSHILSEIRHLSDRIAIIRNGLIEDIDVVRGLDTYAYKNIQVSAREEHLKVLDHFPGLEEKLKENGRRTYLYRGDLSVLIGELGKVQVANITIEDPSLEEIFLHYYE